MGILGFLGVIILGLESFICFCTAKVVWKKTYGRSIKDTLKYSTGDLSFAAEEARLKKAAKEGVTPWRALQAASQNPEILVAIGAQKVPQATGLLCKLGTVISILGRRQL